jgi:hypothetical protein
MSHAITAIEDVTPAWLTTVLGRHGAHNHTVEHVAVTGIHDEQLHSISYRLEAGWAPGAPPSLPTRLFLKLPRQPDADGIASSGAREIATYQFLAEHQAALPIIPCYDAVYDAQQHRYHLLLADLSQSHDQPRWHLSIDEPYVQRTVDCLAQVHAYWWDQPTRCRAIATLPTAADIAAEVQWVQDALPGFFASLSTPLTSEEQNLYARLVAAAPQLWARRLDPAHPTLVHGDAHFWNFLYPHTDDTLPTYILDWQKQHIDWGVSDLAYMLVLRYPHRTPANERMLVQRYYHALAQHGVTNYAWQTCWDNYRRAALEQLLVPIQWYDVGLPDGLWQLFVPRALAAYRELACEELLGRDSQHKFR